MTREGGDFDMKLPSTLREVFKYGNKYIFSRKKSLGGFKLTHQTVVSCQDQPLPCHCALFATESSLRANACELRRRSSLRQLQISDYKPTRHPSPTLHRLTFSTCSSCLQVLDMLQTPNNGHSIPCGTSIGLD